MNDTAAATANDLTRPLGAALKRQSRAALPAKTIFAVLSGMMVAVLAGQIWIGSRQDPNAPVVVSIAVRQAPVAVAAPDKPDSPAASAAPQTRNVMSAEESEHASGVKVVRGGGEAAPGSMIITVPSVENAEPKLNAAPDRRLIERSRHGVLPRMGADGARPSAIYARPVLAAAIAGKPRIAIVVGGLGISQASTTDAIAKLPGAVTLAFAPYATELDRQAARARSDGHEILLQMPMEPFDYPENDPGPHTLRTSGDAADNIDRLHWVMSRFSGYTGIVNFMGAKFTAQDSALRPVMKDIADRGLVMLDDGSSNRSLIGDMAASLKLPAARADGIIDVLARPDAIDRELAKLETRARENGVAIGTANAIPLTIERIARWSKTLQDRGIVLVPVTHAIQARRTAAP
ncbi:MAG: divergent polysaccharide deacetylase family protein [Beijerinckiaceae bacterium]